MPSHTMRLLYVCSDFGIVPSGVKGASIHLRAITAALARHGCEVMLLSPRPGPDGDHPARRLLPPGCPPVDDVVKPLRRWLSAQGLDDAIASDLRGLCYSSWAPAAARTALESVGFKPQVILERLSLFSTVGIELADATGVPLVVEVNALLTEEAENYRTLQCSELATAIQGRVLERADAVIAVSQALADRLVTAGVDARKIHVVPNGADDGFFRRDHDGAAVRRELGLEHRFVVSFVGSLKPWHGVEVLIDAFAVISRNHSDARLLIIGTGPQEAALREQAARRGVADAVVFAGAVEHQHIPDWLAAVDVAAAPFTAMKGFYFSPIKLFEYMAAGRCVVASRLGQIEEVVTDGEDGLLVPPNDPAAIAEALERLHSSPSARTRLGAAAAAKAKARYTWAHAAEKVLAVIEHLLRLGKSQPETTAAAGVHAHSPMKKEGATV